MDMTETWLVDPLLNERVVRITEEAQIDLSVLSSGEFAIEAVLADGTSAGSVAFSINGDTRIENAAPYASFGDRSGNFHGSNVISGPVNVEISVFEERNGQGDVLESLTTSFYFVDGDGAPTETSKPAAPVVNDPVEVADEEPDSEPSQTLNSGPEPDYQPTASIGADETTVLKGDYGYKEPYFHLDDDNHFFDARDAVFRGNITGTNGDASHPVRFSTDNHDNGYMIGGLVYRDDPEDITWDESYGVGYGGRTHNGAVYIVGREDHGSFTVDGTRIHNTHDGVVVGQGFGHDRTVTVKNVYGTNVRDDAFENDSFHNMIISDNLIDGAFVGYSSRAGSSAGDIDHSSERVSVLQNNIIRLEKMPGAPSGDRTDDGHGRLFKLDSDRGPALVLKNNIFVIEEEGLDAFSGGGAKTIAYSENNTLIWMGRGEYKYDLPDGFTLVDGNMSAFDDAKDDWLADRGYGEGDLEASGNVFRNDSSIINGDGDANRMVGTTRDDVIVAGAGNDWVFAGGGDDVVYGNLGSDTLNGGAGRDVIVGGEGGKDTFITGDGFDQIFGFGSGDKIEVSLPSDAAGSARFELVSKNGDTIVRVDKDGSGDFVDVARVVGVKPGALSNKVSLTFDGEAAPIVADPVPPEPEPSPVIPADPGPAPVDEVEEEPTPSPAPEPEPEPAPAPVDEVEEEPAPEPDPAPAPEPIQEGLMRLFLIDSKTDEVVRELASADNIETGELSSDAYNLQAVYEGGTVGSMQFFKGDTLVSTENKAPYAAYGDRRGDYRNEDLPTGGEEETFEVRAYSGKNGSGDLLYSQKFELGFGGSGTEPVVASATVNALTIEDFVPEEDISPVINEDVEPEAIPMLAEPQKTQEPTVVEITPTSHEPEETPAETTPASAEPAETPVVVETTTTGGEEDWDSFFELLFGRLLGFMNTDDVGGEVTAEAELSNNAQVLEVSLEDVVPTYEEDAAGAGFEVDESYDNQMLLIA